MSGMLSTAPGFSPEALWRQICAHRKENQVLIRLLRDNGDLLREGLRISGLHVKKLQEAIDSLAGYTERLASMNAQLISASLEVAEKTKEAADALRDFSGSRKTSQG